MDKLDPILGYVSDLEKFANLKVEGVEDFSRLNFLPHEAWVPRPVIILSPNNPPQTGSKAAWWVFQKKVQDLWRGFPFDQSLELVVDIDRLSQQTKRWDDFLQQSNDEVQKLANEGPPKPETWPIQKAIWFLNVNPWRAKFCQICLKPFAIIAPNNTRKQSTCTSMDCKTEAARRRQKRWGMKTNWGRGGAELRQPPKVKKSSKKGGR